MLDEPEEQIVGLGHGGGKVPGAFVGHDDYRPLFVDLAERRRNAQDPEKRKLGSRVKIISERPEHSETQPSETAIQ